MECTADTINTKSYIMGIYPFHIQTSENSHNGVKSENPCNICLCGILLNEDLAKVKGSPNSKFNPKEIMMD